MTDLDEFGTEFPHSDRPSGKARAGRQRLTRYDQMTGTSRRGLLAIHGIGPKAVRILGEELARRGAAFADD